MKLTHRIIILILVALLGSVSLFAQSTNLRFPTPVTTNEISGKIEARDIGDARLTSFFYQFDGGQGDLFINIVTRNFNGEIDVFTRRDLRPLSKIIVYADFAEQETGRVIYLRKPEELLLRIQGRTPSDDPASFRIKFAGSFIASTVTEPVGPPELPTVTPRNDRGINVNSVGTIIPNPTPSPQPPTVAEVEKPEPAKVEEQPKAAPTEATKPKVEVVVTDKAPVKTPPPTKRGPRNRRGVPPTTTAEAPPAKTPTKVVDPMENIHLVILFKDGSTIQRPMTEVLKFSVDKGILTVVSKDGSIGRYSIVAVAKVTIE